MKIDRDFKENLCKETFGITMEEAHKQNICVECREFIHKTLSRNANNPGGVYSNDGISEYGITGLCEYCFDKIMEPYDEE